MQAGKGALNLNLNLNLNPWDFRDSRIKIKRKIRIKNPFAQRHIFRV